MIQLTIRCPSCKHEGDFAVPLDMPMAGIPEIAKDLMRCKCKNRIPKINKYTPVLGSLVRINGVPAERFIGPKWGVN